MSDPATLQVYVKGTPRPQPRPRFVDGKAISTASKPAKAYRANVLAACKRVRAQCGQIEGPAHLTLCLWFAHGKHKDRAGQPHTHRPDGDNVLKLWQDCAQKAGLVRDDSQVCMSFVYKAWSATAGAIMVLRAVDGGSMDTQDDDDDLGACEPSRGIWDAPHESVGLF